MSVLAVPYERPALDWPGESATEQHWLAWVVFVFTLTAAMVWASYCIYTGGQPDVDIGWFRIKISCYK